MSALARRTSPPAARTEAIASMIPLGFYRDEVRSVGLTPATGGCYVADMASEAPGTRAHQATAPTAEADDAVLIEAVAAGDRDGLGRLYRRHAPALMAVGLRVLRTRREAEDVLHDVFLEVWRQAHDFDPRRGSVRTWMLMRMRSRALDRVKSAGYARVSSLDAEPRQVASRAGDDDPAAAVDHARLRRALGTLPAEQRAVLELGYFEGLSSQEMADRLAVPVGTVKSRVKAGLDKLRGELAAVRGES